MENSDINTRKWRLPGKSDIRSAFYRFSRTDWVIFAILTAVFMASGISMLQIFNKSMMVNVPMRGGEITEGIVGTPRFINPVLAFSDADQDMVSLVYSGLMRKHADGSITPDLAEKYEISADGLKYTFTLKDGIFFHDGTPVTASDVIFTINKVKDGVIKSPRKVNWDGVSVENPDGKTLVFTLRQPYASFLENTTLGIMPQAVWNNSPIELNNANTNPVGSGPYMVKNISKQSSGIIASYELVPFKKFALGEPYIKNIVLRFYGSEEDMIKALEDGSVDQISSIKPSSAEDLKEKNYQIQSSMLPRIFGLFFNQNQNQLFIDKTIVSAIDRAIDKDRIIRDVLFGYGVAIDDPIPPNMIAYQKLEEETKTSREETLKAVAESLAKDGWTKGEDGFLVKTTTEKNKKTTIPLEFSISTGNAPELAEAALLIEEDLREIGMKVDVKTFDVGNLNQGVIRPRKYDALLFGQIINNESDLFAFWHSSQRKDPGLNVAMYTNARVDKILEEAFTTADEETRIKKYAQFEDEIKKDMPAVFLYSPNFIYVVSGELKGISIDHIISPGDRFLDAYSWYTETEDVWKIFAKK